MDVKVVVNTQFEAGMYSSVQAGVRKLGVEVEAFFLLPVDHPLVAAATVKRMVDYYAFSGKGILYPTFHGRRGHPPLISVRYAHGILQNSGPQGLRGLLSLYVHDTFNVSVEDEAVLLDMDVPDDYQSLLHYLADKGHGANHGFPTFPGSR
jgi:CTP:molybdopterin cytidylyltransferase MocA